jgi:hypothetical protein
VSNQEGSRVATLPGPGLRPELLEAARDALQGARLTRPSGADGRGPILRLDGEAALALYAVALAQALGLDLEAASHGVDWQDGEDRLRIEPGDVQLALLDGFALVQIPVATEAAGEAEVVVPFATRRSGQAAGPATAAPPVPRGPEALVARWGEALVAVAHRALLDLAEALARVAGEREGTSLVAAGFTAGRDTLRVESRVARAGEGG